jgi:hypothetical protein
MNIINKSCIAFAALALIIVLAIISEPYGHGYNADDRNQMNALIDSLQYNDTPASKLIYLYSE